MYFDIVQCCLNCFNQLLKRFGLLFCENCQKRKSLSLKYWPWVTVMNSVFVCWFSGVDLTADSLMERLDNGVLLCQLAQLLQDKMVHNNNGKVLQQHKVMRMFTRKHAINDKLMNANSCYQPRSFQKGCIWLCTLIVQMCSIHDEDASCVPMHPTKTKTKTQNFCYTPILLELM